ncbi:MAG: nucleotide pyrophosphatase, partial [Acidobacteriota bacterium]
MHRPKARFRPGPWILAIAAGWALATPALAYIGPGAGFAAIGSVLALLLAMIAGFLTLLTWPFRMLVTWLRGRKTYSRALVKRTVILGLDGL